MDVVANYVVIIFILARNLQLNFRQEIEKPKEVEMMDLARLPGLETYKYLNYIFIPIQKNLYYTF